MWIIGHTACAYLLTKLIYKFRKKKMQPDLIVFIFIFANLIDSLHLGILRNMSHCLIGTITYLILWLFILKKYKLIKKEDFPALFIAGSTHIIMDIIFSDYYVFYPFDSTLYSVYGWNSPEHMIVGSLIIIIFIIIFILSGDFLNLRLFIHEERKTFIKDFYFKKIFNKAHFTFSLFIVFYVFLIAQFLIFIILFYNVLLEGIWYVWMFLIVFIFFSVVIHFLLFGFNKSNNSNM